jgi:hypothetical protein
MLLYVASLFAAHPFAIYNLLQFYAEKEFTTKFRSSRGWNGYVEGEDETLNISFLAAF